MSRDIKTRVRCNLAQYYGDHVSIFKFSSTLGELWNKKLPALKDITRKDYWKKVCMWNMASLGFVLGNSPTPRGISFHACSLLSEHSKINNNTHNAMLRFIILKAMADTDRDCFFQLWYDAEISGITDYEEIRKTFFSRDQPANFRHRYRFHRLLAEETNLLNVARIKFLELGHLPDIGFLNPYEDCFLKDEFLEVKLTEPSIQVLKQTLNDSVLQYYNLISQEKFGFSEILKTILQCLLLNKNLYCSEQSLSKWVLENGGDCGCMFYKSSKPVLRMGRGFYIAIKNKIDLFTYFTHTKNF